MKKLKITIVTYNWIPRNTISTHRPYSWARYWSKNGHDVTVLTAKKQSFDRPLGLNLPELKNVKVIETPYKLFWGPILKFSLIEKTSKLLRKKFLNYIGPYFDPRNTWYSATSPVFSKLARDTDILISTYGPEAAHTIGSKMKIINPKIYWVADYRDLWTENPSFIDLNKRLKEKIKKIEIETLRNADLISSVSHDMSLRLKQLHKKPSIKITNGFDIDDKVLKKNLLKKISKSKRLFRIVYTGSIYSDETNPIILLDAILSLIKKNKIPKKSIILEFYGARLDNIKKLSLMSKYSHLIRVMDHKSRTKILKIQKKADLLLLMASSKEISRGVLTGKIFEYISSGRPILCVGGRSDFEIAQVLKSTKSGLVFDINEKNKLENIIYETYCGEGLFKKYKPNINEILKFSRKRIANNFLKKIKLISKKSNLNNNIKHRKNSKNKPTITHIITGLEKGGAERFLYNLLTNGLQKSFNNKVISLMSEGHYGPLLKKKLPVNCLNLKRGQINILAVIKLIKILLKDKPDIIQGWMYHGNLAALVGLFIFKKKLKISWNIRQGLEIFSEMKLLTRLAIKLGKIFSNIPDLILYNSVRSIMQHRDLGFMNLNDYYIPNGFDTQKWKPNKKMRKKVRNQLGIPSNTKVIGYVGRDDKQKDLPNLFKAFEIVKKQKSNIILVAVGKKLRKYAINTDRIIFLDERTDVHNLMTGFDFLCLCSKAEGFPNVLGEAMSTGLSCVTTNAGDAKEIVGKTGWVVPSNNYKLLSKSLKETSNYSHKKLLNYGNVARKKIINDYSIDVVKDQYVSLYNSLLNINN